LHTGRCALGKSSVRSADRELHRSFAGASGERITRGALRYRALRAFRRAGINAERARWALVHGLRHTYATELANASVSVYTLMKFLGHESMVTSQRYVVGAGIETRSAAAQNTYYGASEAVAPGRSPLDCR